MSVYKIQYSSIWCYQVLLYQMVTTKIKCIKKVYKYGSQTVALLWEKKCFVILNYFCIIGKDSCKVDGTRMYDKHNESYREK